MNRYIKNNTQIVNNMKRYAISSVIQEMNLKTKDTITYILEQLKPTILIAGNDAEQWALSLLMGMLSGTAILENNLADSYRVKHSPTTQSTDLKMQKLFFLCT